MELSRSKIKKLFIYQEIELSSPKIKAFLRLMFSYTLGMNFLSTKNQETQSEELSGELLYFRKEIAKSEKQTKKSALKKFFVSMTFLQSLQK